MKYELTDKGKRMQIIFIEHEYVYNKSKLSSSCDPDAEEETFYSGPSRTTSIFKRYTQRQVLLSAQNNEFWPLELGLVIGDGDGDGDGDVFGSGFGSGDVFGSGDISGHSSASGEQDGSGSASEDGGKILIDYVETESIEDEPRDLKFLENKLSQPGENE